MVNNRLTYVKASIETIGGKYCYILGNANSYEQSFYDFIQQIPNDSITHDDMFGAANNRGSHAPIFVEIAPISVGVLLKGKSGPNVWQNDINGSDSGIDSKTFSLLDH